MYEHRIDPYLPREGPETISSGFAPSALSLYSYLSTSRGAGNIIALRTDVEFFSMYSSLSTSRGAGNGSNCVPKKYNAANSIDTYLPREGPETFSKSVVSRTLLI